MKNHTCTSSVYTSKQGKNHPSTVVNYANWLNTRDWDCFCTFTTKYSLTLKTARRLAERLHEFLTRNNIEIDLFWVAEPNDLKYGYHLHALISLKCVGEKDIKKFIEHIKNTWQIVSRGKGGKEFNNTTIKPYQKDKGAHYYVAKYMMRQNADYDFYFANNKTLQNGTTTRNDQ